MSAILEVRNLSKKYAEFAAVKSISFDIEEGEIFSLLGPNGAGKTTTISMLSTLYNPSGGDALIGGHSICQEAMAVRLLPAGLNSASLQTGSGSEELRQQPNNLNANLAARAVQTALRGRGLIDILPKAGVLLYFAVVF